MIYHPRKRDQVMSWNTEDLLLTFEYLFMCDINFDEELWKQTFPQFAHEIEQLRKTENENIKKIDDKKITIDENDSDDDFSFDPTYFFFKYDAIHITFWELHGYDGDYYHSFILETLAHYKASKVFYCFQVNLFNRHLI